MADWHWEPVTDGLLDELPPAALAAVRQVAEELTVRESMIFLDGREFTGEPPGLLTAPDDQVEPDVQDPAVQVDVGVPPVPRALPSRCRRAP